MQNSSAPGYDWVDWRDIDGDITAVYVFPKGPAARAGIEEGDILYKLADQQFFDVESLKDVISTVPAGNVIQVEVSRDGELRAMEVRFSGYPTFMYPLDAPLWMASLWGFLLGAFIHLVGMTVVAPLSVRSRQGMLSLLLILASATWVFGNLLRLAGITLLGPPAAIGQFLPSLFKAVTIISLIGWTAFPALLIHKVLFRVPGFVRNRALCLTLVWLPAAILIPAVLAGSVDQLPGSITLDDVMGAILYYVACYIGASGLFGVLFGSVESDGARRTRTGWGTAASLIIFVVSVVIVLVVTDLLPVLSVVSGQTAGGLIVAAQLLSVVPVALVSYATLRFGKISEVIRTLTIYSSLLGLIFFLFVGGLSLVIPELQERGWPIALPAGGYLIAVLLFVDWLRKRLQPWVSVALMSESRRARRSLRRFSERTNSMIDIQGLATETVATVAKAMNSRSAALFLWPTRDPESWIEAHHHPEPPFITRDKLASVWPNLGDAIWTQNAELNEGALEHESVEILRRHGAAVAVPLKGDQTDLGVLILGKKKAKRAFYNLEDVDLLRAAGSQLSLVIERLNLIEREKELIRTTAEAQLVALRAQINPHFLFNALNTIAALIDEKPEEAEQTVHLLSNIFRHTLRVEGRAFVRLKDELALVNDYLAIERIRFGERLSVNQTIDQELDDLQVPAFALQTIVENAILHGISKKRSGGAVTLTTSRNGDDMATILVGDNGPGLPHAGDTDDTSFYGTGLSNVSARLERLFGRTDLLRLRNQESGGTEVAMSIPLQFKSDAASADQAR